jgi:hypothetical protein
VGNAYLESFTKEKVCFLAGPEFGKLHGHLMVIIKALYGLRSSGICWHEKFVDILRMEDFHPCIGEQDIWLRKNGDIYEYLAVYVE